MQVEVEQFRADGYLIIKNAVPPERLQDLRLSVEMMVDGEKARALTNRKEGEPRGGSWYKSAQGKIINNWSTHTVGYWLRTRRPIAAHYHVK